MSFSGAEAVILKPGKDKPILQRHHWIFSGAVQSFPDFENGSILPVKNHQGEHLGYAYFNRRCSLVGRMVSFGGNPPEKAIKENITRAIACREALFSGENNAYRLINAEGDSLPGLVVDRYHDVLVLQITTLGMEKIKAWILENLVKLVRPRSVLERSVSPERTKEGLPDVEAWVYGEPLATTEINENGVRFLIDFTQAQKTGFYLDQREMRLLVRRLSKGRKVLDCFAYTGGFSVNSLFGGASRAELVEASASSLELARQNLELNGFRAASFELYEADVFTFLRQKKIEADFIILDPPAFAKKKADLIRAGRGYKDINRLALQALPPGGLLLTFSCSHYVNDELFQKILFQAALEAGRSVRILQRMRHSFDHPVSIFHPETHYLKGFLLYVG